MHTNMYLLTDDVPNFFFCELRVFHKKENGLPPYLSKKEIIEQPAPHSCHTSL